MATCCGQRQYEVEPHGLGTFPCRDRVVAAYAWVGAPFRYKGEEGAAVCAVHEMKMKQNAEDYCGLKLIERLDGPTSAPPYADIVEAELIANDIKLCTGCTNITGSHTRGRAQPDTRTIHFNKKMATRKTLLDFLHEVGHIVKGHGKSCKLRRFEREEEAEAYAREGFKAYGLPIPRERAAQGRAYVARMKRFGDNVKAGRRKP